MNNGLNMMPSTVSVHSFVYLNSVLVLGSLSLADITPRLYLEKKGEMLISQGAVSFHTTIDVKMLAEQENSLSSAITLYTTACKKVEKLLELKKCELLFSGLSFTLDQITTKQAYIEKFFPGKEATVQTIRHKRGILTAIGAMDSGDRDRITRNMERIRSNEERISHAVEHEHEAINKIYYEVTNATQRIDDRIKEIEGYADAMKYEVESGVEITNQVKEMVHLEQELEEAGLWTMQLADHLHKVQGAIINLLTKNRLDVVDLIEFIHPLKFLETLNKREKTLPEGVQFPRSEMGTSCPEVLQVVEFDRVLRDTSVIVLDIKVPIVEKTRFETLKGFITPGLKGAFITATEIEEDILVIHEDVGYAVASETLEQCKRLGKTYLCHFHKPQENLRVSKNCIAELYYGKQSDQCSSRLIKTVKDTWLATLNPNEWMYISPKETDLVIKRGSNLTTLTIVGTGLMQLAPNMSISTPQVFIAYQEFDNNQMDVIPTYVQLKTPNLTLDDIKLAQVPVMNKSQVSFISKKKLYDLGVDVGQLVKEEIPLDNPSYAPLRNPWFSTTAFLVITIVVLFVLLLNKSRLSCCTKKRNDPRVQYVPAVETLLVSRAEVEKGVNEHQLNPARIRNWVE